MAAAVVGGAVAAAAMAAPSPAPASAALPFDSAAFPVPSYAGEVAIVTGGTTGIGAACCAVLARAGAKVYSLDVATPTAAPPAGVTPVQCDVSSPRALRRAVDAIAAREGRIDHLVSNAGVWHGGAYEDVTERDFDRVVGINVKGCYFAIQAVLPTMRKQQRGSVVIIGSDQSIVGKPEQNLYGMTKGAIAQLTKSCAAQYAPEGVRFNCVCPGTIDTPLMHGAVADFASKKGEAKDDLYTWLATAQPFPRIGTPDEVAHAVAFIGKVPFIVGAQLSVDGGYTCQ